MTTLRLAAPRLFSLPLLPCLLLSTGLTACGEGHLLEPVPTAAMREAAAAGAVALTVTADDYSVYDDRAAFTAAGTVAFTNGFEEFTGSSMYFPSNPWTAKGVTYTSGDNLILGPSFGSGIAGNVILYGSYTPMTGQLAASSAFTMFGVDLSTLERRDPIDVVMTTNLGSYRFDDLNVPLAGEGQLFFGIALSRAGEYLTEFSFASEGVGSAPLLTNVTVGHVAAASGNLPPAASIGGPYSGTEGAPITLGFAGADANGDALTYAWDLGDGTTGTGPTPPSNHAYVDDGAYTVSLTVTDGNGGSDTRTTTATIGNANPEVAPFSVPTSLVALGPSGATVGIRTTFTDPGVQDTHVTDLDCGGGAASGVSALADGGPGAAVAGLCTYNQPGVFVVRVTVRDDDGGVDTETGSGQVVVYDPSAGSITGGGWIASPAGAYPSAPSLTGKVTFGFVARYERSATAPTGNAEFKLRFAGVEFRSTGFDWLVITGQRARCEGTGTLNGGGAFGFALTAVDDDALGDRVRIRIWDRTSGVVVYDNLVGESPDAAAAAALGAGSIQIRTK